MLFLHENAWVNTIILIFGSEMVLFQRKWQVLAIGAACLMSICQASATPFDDAETEDPQAYLRALTKDGYQSQVPFKTGVGAVPVLDPSALDALRARTRLESEGVAEARFAAEEDGPDVAGSAKAAGEAVGKLGEKAANAAKQVGAAVADKAKEVWQNRELYYQKGRKAIQGAVRAGKEMQKFVLSHRKEYDTMKSALKEKMGAVFGSTPPMPTMTDVEWCTGCQLVLSQMQEHTNGVSDMEELLFALHSACHETPPILREACDVLVDRDQLAVEALIISPDIPSVCQTIGMCYPELLQ